MLQHQDKGFTTVLDRIKVSKDRSEATKIFVNELLPKFVRLLVCYNIDQYVSVLDSRPFYMSGLSKPSQSLHYG